MDNLSKTQRRKNMQNIRSRNTSIEKRIKNEISKYRFKYSQNVSSVFGKPDFVLFKKKIAIFTDSCFWHSCRYHYSIPKTNKKYWIRKLNNNKKRDIIVNRKLKQEGWIVVRIWEHQIKNDFQKVAKRIFTILSC
ncbi:MAG: very short patch repair endonuclease [Bacteroidota bacterium]|jgi:DNA mismatch endonuclease (patch repair protein)